VDFEEKLYGRDEVIFREGEAGEAAYVVVQGHVELTKRGSQGPLLVGLLGPMDIFGETALFDDTPYDVSARAAEKSRIRVMRRPQLLEWLKYEPAAAGGIGRQLAERLRGAHRLMLAQHEGRLAGTNALASDGPWSLLRTWLTTRLGSRRRADGDGRPLFQIGIATVNNDVDGAWTRALASLLDGQSGLSIRILPVSLQIEPGADQTQATAAALRARQLLARHQELDLLIWGDVHADGYSLWFSPQRRGNDERPGCFNLFTSLELSGDQQPPAGEVLAIQLLAALEPADQRRAAHAQLLRAAELPLHDLLTIMPPSWNLEQQRTALAGFGHALASLAVIDPSGPWGQQAIDAYRAAVMRLPPDQQGIDAAQLHKHLGVLRLAQIDRNPEWLEQAILDFKAAAICLPKARYPLEWGNVQNRLGLALYRLDQVTGRPELLKEAMVAFQSALQAFPRQEAPDRWAEVTHNLAQVLQVYGDQMKNAEVLQRAVETARAAIELRPRARMPLDWAASQNTLGTALFMLAKLSRGAVDLAEATAAITGALEVYRQFGATRLAEVTEKNLVHLQKLSQQRRAGPTQRAHWSEVDTDP
jgi:tetratricopeptide (TPR) repeat protein